MARAWPGSTLDNLRSPLPRAAVETFLAIYSRPSITWADLTWLRARTRLPIVLKGVLHPDDARRALDRKSTRLNSSHANISYAVFCLKKKKQIQMLPKIAVELRL